MLQLALRVQLLLFVLLSIHELCCGAGLKLGVPAAAADESAKPGMRSALPVRALRLSGYAAAASRFVELTAEARENAGASAAHQRTRAQQRKLGVGQTCTTIEHLDCTCQKERDCDLDNEGWAKADAATPCKDDLMCCRRLKEVKVAVAGLVSSQITGDLFPCEAHCEFLQNHNCHYSAYYCATVDKWYLFKNKELKFEELKKKKGAKGMEVSVDNRKKNFHSERQALNHFIFACGDYHPGIKLTIYNMMDPCGGCVADLTNAATKKQVELTIKYVTSDSTRKLHLAGTVKKCVPMEDWTFKLIEDPPNS